jgi:hypothetical protein
MHIQTTMRSTSSAHLTSYSTPHITSTVPSSHSFLHELYNHLTHHLLGPTTQGASLERVVLHRHALPSPSPPHSTSNNTPSYDHFSISYTLTAPSTPAQASPSTAPQPRSAYYKVPCPSPVPQYGVMKQPLLYQIRVIGGVSPQHAVRVIGEVSPAYSIALITVIPSPPNHSTCHLHRPYTHRQPPLLPTL